MNAKFFEIPNSGDPFINAFLDSLKRRRKAFKHKSSSITCERVLVDVDKKRLEKIELTIKPLHSHVKSSPLCVDIWEDRWIELSFSGWKEGTWDWSWIKEGTVLPTATGKLLINTIERTISTSFEMNKDNIGKFDRLWQSLIAMEPQ